MRLAHTLYLVRHGETDWNAERRYQGQIDIPINEKGHAQARRNGRELRGLLETRGVDPLGLMYLSSPLTRTRTTMELMRETLGLPAPGYQTDARLIEASYGVWEGLTIPEIEARDADVFARRKADPGGFAPAGGESYDMLRERVRPVFEALHRDTVMVTHGGVIKVFRGMFEKLDAGQMLALDAPQDQVLLVEGDSISFI
jgi:broad specificity phosphatase PhoE